MAMLSKLIHFELVDDLASRAKLVDLAITLESDYPPITSLLFLNPELQLMMLRWEAVERIDSQRSIIKVADLNSAEAASADFLNTKVLLKRDVMDALVLDLHNRRATRANDLWLEEVGERLLLKAADTSSRAVLRRLSRGRFGAKPSRAPYDWKYIEFLRGDPRAVRRGAGYRMYIRRLPAGEIAGLSRSLPYLHAAELITLLPDPQAADTLEAMPPRRRLQVFCALDDDQAVALLALMAPDDAADLVGRLSPDLAKTFLERLPDARRERLIELLRYPDDTVGGIMTNEVVTLPIDVTIREARIALRERLAEPDFTHFIYVVENDETRILRGTVTLRDVVRAEDEQRLEEIMNPYTSTLDPLEPANNASYRVLNEHKAALPVVGRERQLLGIVTVDAAVMRVAPANWSTQAPKIFS